MKKSNHRNGHKKLTRIAIAQFAPAYLDKDATLKKGLKILEQAAAKKVQLVVLGGETWFPGYPAWVDSCPNAALWGHPATKRVFAALRENSVAVNGPEIRELRQ